MDTKLLNLLIALVITIATTPVCSAWLAPRVQSEDASYLHLHEHTHDGETHFHVHHHHDGEEDGDDDGDHHGSHDCGQDLTKRSWAAPRGTDVDAPPALTPPVLVVSEQTEAEVARRIWPPPRPGTCHQEHTSIRTTVLQV